MSYQVMLEIKSKARTLNGINKAIESRVMMDPGEKWFSSQKELDDSIKAGFIEFTKTKIIIYEDS